MKQEDINQIVEAIKDSRQPESESKKLLDSIIKIATGLTSIGIIWIGSSILELSREVNDLKVRFEYVQEFTKKPRFTSDDFGQKIAPLVQDLDNVQRTLDKREVWIEQTNETINAINLRLQQLEN